MKYIKRIIVLPFVIGIVLMAHLIFVVKRTIDFVKYGGEFIQYDQEENKTIKDIYEEIKNQRE